jgi:thymidylate kinase/thymidylate synthase ThyX
MSEAAQGKFIVIEGTDGSGKGTQFKLLKEHLERAGHEVVTFDFPQYDKASSHFVREYLNGIYGSANEVGPYTASLFYALDRFEAATKIKEALEAGKIVLANRFTASNMAHQGTKFEHIEERRGYFIWLDNLEFMMLKIPRPDMNFVLRVPADIAQGLVDQKETRGYTDKKRDIHEADLTHLERSVQVYDDLCSLFPQDFQRIDCVRGGKLMSVEDIQKIVWEKVNVMVPKPHRNKKSSTNKAANTDTNPYVTKTGKSYEVTADGKKYLQETVTNSTSNVYGFSDKLSPVTIAAGMARLSRRADDMRITILDEFAHAMDKDAQLLHRVITAYGDDSVQQLVGQHIVVEEASNLLTKKLEWGRLAAYLEQSTRYIYYDQKNKSGKYRYYIPDYLNAKTKQRYIEVMDSIFELYSEMVHRMTEYVQKESTVPEAERDAAWKGATRAQACDAIRPVLPVATTSTVGIFASGQALESLIMHLMSDEFPEARETGQKILDEARKNIPTFLERADKPERGGAMIAYRANTRNAVKKIAYELLPDNHAAESDPVTMNDIWPKNELDIVADMVYEHSSLPLEQIRKEVDGWTYDQKLTAFNAYMGERLNRRHRPGRALEKTHYSFDLLCDYGIFRDLQRHRMVDDMEWQELTPRYGFEVPKLVEDAALVDLFERCFDMSLELYSELQAAGYAAEAQYATLFGHRIRWKVTMNAREAFHFFELRTAPQGHPGYRKLAYQMYEKVAERHPLTAEHMKFVNSDEDPELTRLAAERYTQFKLQALDEAKK